MLQQNLHLYAMDKHHFPKIKSKHKTEKNASLPKGFRWVNGDWFLLAFHTAEATLQKGHCVGSEVATLQKSEGQESTSTLLQRL